MMNKTGIIFKITVVTWFLISTLLATITLNGCCRDKRIDPVEASSEFVKEIVADRVNPDRMTQVTQIMLADKENYLKYMPKTLALHTCGRPKSLSVLVYDIYKNKPRSKDFKFHHTRDSISTDGKTAWVWFVNEKQNDSPTWVIKLININGAWLVDLPMID